MNPFLGSNTRLINQVMDKIIIQHTVNLQSLFSNIFNVFLSDAVMEHHVDPSR